MSFLAFEYTSAQMLVAAILAFVLLVAVAAWFYRSASAEEAKPAPGLPTSAPKPTVNTPKTFIPVVRPPSRPAGRPATAPSAATAPISNGEVRATPRPTPAEPVTPPKSRPPSLALSAAVDTAPSGAPVLVVKARGYFPEVSGRSLVFALDFVLAGDPAAKVRRRDADGCPLGDLSCRTALAADASGQEWQELLSVPVDELSLPKSGTHLVRVDCSALLTDMPQPQGGALPSDAMVCAASAELALSQEGMGYQDLERWLLSRESALVIVAGCASSASPDREAHREIVLNWIMAECATLPLSQDERKSLIGSLLARFGSCQLGVKPSAVGCEALASSMDAVDPLRDSLGDVFAKLALATNESVEPLDRIDHACHWLKLNSPPACASVRRRINLRTPPGKPPDAPTSAPAQPAPTPHPTQAAPASPTPQATPTPRPTQAGQPSTPIKPAPTSATTLPVVPFAVTLKLIGQMESAKGFRVYVSGDLPAAASPDVQVVVSVLDTYDDAKRAFMVLPDDIDVVAQVLLPKTVFPRTQYDARAPRQVAEILFAECAYPRSGERTLRVACAAYAVGQGGTLSHLRSAETSASVKIPGAGYVLQQKRRRVRRGVVLKLALAAVSFAGTVSLAQKSAVKDWIDAEAAKINDKGEARQTVNYLTKILLKSAPVTHAELLALAAELAGRQDVRLSAQAVQLVETLISTKPSSEPVVRPYLEKISQELGLTSVAPTVPAKPKARPAKPKAKPAAVPRPSANPSVRRALVLNRKLGRTVPDWSSMTPEAKVAHVKSVLLLLQAQMSSRSGLADRNSLQEKIDDHAQLVVLIRVGSA